MNSAPMTKASLRHRSLTGYTQVWLARDHILVLRSLRVQEKYQRFLFADIQAMVITEGPDSTMPRALWGVGALILFAWAMSATTIGGRVFLGTIALFTAGLLVREVMRGPRCRFILQTAISREKINALSRTREALAFIERATPLIEGSQQHMQPAEPAPVTGFAEFSVTGAATTPPRLPQKTGFAAESFFGLLLLTGLLIFAASREPMNTFFGLLVLVYLSEFVLGGIAVAQARSRRSALLIIAVASVALIAIDAVFLVGARTVSTFFSQVAKGGGPQALAAPLNFGGNIVLFSVGWRVLAGAIGLLGCRWERAQEPS